MFSSKILFLVLPRSQETTHTWPAKQAVFWCVFRLWYVKYKIRPRKSWTEVTRMKRGERGPEKEGRKTTSPLATTSSPPPPRPLDIGLAFALCISYLTKHKRKTHQRKTPYSHTTNLIRVRVGFLWVWLLLRRTFFVCFSLFSFLLHIFKLFSTLLMWINLVLLFLRLTTLYRRLQSPFRSRLRPESGAKYGYPDLRSFPVHSFHVVFYQPEQRLCFVPS